MFCFPGNELPPNLHTSLTGPDSLEGPKTWENSREILGPGKIDCGDDSQTQAMIRFGALTEDEVFKTCAADTAGVEICNTGSEPLVGLCYFGPDTFAKVPNVGDAG